MGLVPRVRGAKLTNGISTVGFAGDPLPPKPTLQGEKGSVNHLTIFAKSGLLDMPFRRAMSDQKLARMPCQAVDEVTWPVECLLDAVVAVWMVLRGSPHRGLGILEAPGTQKGDHSC